MSGSIGIRCEICESKEVMTVMCSTCVVKKLRPHLHAIENGDKLYKLIRKVMMNNKKNERYV